MCTWIFWFDGEIDTGGELTTDAAGTRHICDLTLQCVEHCLHPDPAKACFTQPVDSPGTVAVLYEVLIAMRQEMGPMSIGRMRRELHEYIEGVARQQAVRQDEHLPDPGYHFEIRIADIGVYPSITQTEFAMDFELPDSTRYHEAMKTIATECTRLSTELSVSLGSIMQRVRMLWPVFPGPMMRWQMCIYVNMSEVATG